MSWCSIFFFNDTATTEIYTLSLHDALPISERGAYGHDHGHHGHGHGHHHHHDHGHDHHHGHGHSHDHGRHDAAGEDRKSTRLNSSHANISYAVFCLKKKNTS